MQQTDKIYIAGHRGMVGSAIKRYLEKNDYENLVYRTSSELDLRNSDSVKTFFDNEKPEYVFLSAAKVGGIHANNTYRADFIYDNMMIQSNVIYHACRTGVKKLLILGSSCIYPRLAPQPIKEESLLTGPLEPTNEPYAIAKIAGIKMCEAYRHQYGCNFITVMPTNLYGPADNYDLDNSHVLPALIRKFHEAKIYGNREVTIWGTGKPMREFLYADDLADACVFLMLNYDEGGPVNVGVGVDISIAELARMIRDVVGYNGDIRFNPEMPDGTPRKLLDVSKIRKLGWKHKISLVEGIHLAYSDFLKNKILHTTSLVA